MAFQSVPNAAEVVCIYDQQGEITQNSFHFTYTTVWTKSILTTVCDAVGLWWQDNLSPHINQNTTLIGTQGKGLEFINDVQAVGDLGAGTIGGIITTPAPNSNSFSCWRKSSFTGKSARGRVYIAGLSLSDISNNRLSAVRADAFVAALEVLREGSLLPPGVTHVVVSRKTGGAFRPVGVTFAIESYGYANLVLDSRRDRMPE